MDTLRSTAARLVNERRLRIAGMAVLGGALLLVGAMAPWLTLYGGLQTLAGTAGLNGRLLFAGGMLSILAGSAYLLAARRSLRWTIGFLGFACLAFAGWLLVELVKTSRQLSTDPFLFAGLGPGLFVAAAGALIVFATLFIDDDV